LFVRPENPTPDPISQTPAIFQPNEAGQVIHMLAHEKRGLSDRGSMAAWPVLGHIVSAAGAMLAQTDRSREGA